MDTTTPDTGRTARLLALMKKGDDAFNAHDFAAMDAVHHPDMIAHLPGSAEPLHGRAAHATAMGQFFRSFPDVHVDNDPYQIQFGSGGNDGCHHPRPSQHGEALHRRVRRSLPRDRLIL